MTKPTPKRFHLAAEHVQQLFTHTLTTLKLMGAAGDKNSAKLYRAGLISYELALAGLGYTLNAKGKLKKLPITKR